MAEPTQTAGAGADLPARRVRLVQRHRRALPRPPSAPSRAHRPGDAASGGRGRDALGRVVGGRGASTSRGRHDEARPRGWARWSPSADQLGLLASLLDAGLPLADALRTLGDMAIDRTVRAAFVRLQSLIQRGERLAVGLAALGVSPHVVMLVDGGERTGRLADALRGAAALTARIEMLRGEVRRALVYPGVVLAIGLAILTVIAIAVVPPLERTFTDLGGELPRATRIVLAASRPLSSPVSLTVGTACAIGVAVLRRASPRLVAGPGRRSPSGRWPRVAALGPLVEAARDRLPLSGPLRRDLRVTVVAHVIATLTRGGVPVDAALRHVADGLPAVRMQQLLHDAADAAREGRSPFDEEALGRVLDTAEREMLRVGERNGLVAEQWSRVAQRRDRALEERMRRIGVVIEPVLVALIGGVVGGAVLALYLPTFRVMELL